MSPSHLRTQLFTFHLPFSPSNIPSPHQSASLHHPIAYFLCVCVRACMHVCVYVKKASSCVAQYPVLRTIQSAIHFTSLTDAFTQTPFRLLWEASSHMVQLMREGCSYTYPPLSIVRYSFIQLSELEQCRVKNLAEGFNTAAQDSNPGSRSRESEALPLSHCALCVFAHAHACM